jgi:DNA-binding beta-propeller fold protein YncE
MHRVRRTRELLSTFAFLGAALLAACAGVPEQPATPAAPLVFPPPPDEPRFVFERSFFGSADLNPQSAESTLRRLLTGEVTIGVGFSKPFDVAACRGHIFVSDTASNLVMAFDVPGRRYFEVGTSEPGGLIKPLGLHADSQCNLYVVDAEAKRVMVYQKDGKFLYAVGGPQWFHRPSHVAVDPAGARIFVADTGGVGTMEHRVRVFETRTARHLYDIGSRGVGPGQFNLPRDVKVGPDGLLYVVDGGNFRIQVFKQDGTFVRTFGAVGRQLGQFSRPKGLAIDKEGRIYVSDAAFGNFQIFTPAGELLMFIGTRRAAGGPAKYMLPAGIAVDEDGRVYFVDQYFRKVDIYRPANLAPSAGFLGAWPGAGGNR